MDTEGEAQTDPFLVFTLPFLAVIPFTAALSLWRYGWTRRNSCQIITRTRAEAPTFLSRKKDDLVIEAIVGVISLILGGILGYWINTLT